MKRHRLFTVGFIFAAMVQLRAQGFVNLNFEQANVSGYSRLDYVPVTAALPGWSATASYVGGTYAAAIVYDGISTGGTAISVVDTNVSMGSVLATGFFPFQGRYGVILFGANTVSETISQTGLVPTGTAALLFDARASSATFSVTLGGQTVNVIPLQTFSNYTLYGADISAFAGQSETLSFTEPPAPVGQLGGDPNIFELDNIQFSSSPVPEPSALALGALGALLFVFRAGRAEQPWRHDDKLA